MGFIRVVGTGEDAKSCMMRNMGTVDVCAKVLRHM